MLSTFLYFLNPNFQPLAIFCACTARFVSDVFGHHKDWLSYVPAHGFFPCLVVEIDMVHDDFNPGKKLYERVKWCLNKRPDLMFDLLFTWQPVGKLKSYSVDL